MLQCVLLIEVPEETVASHSCVLGKGKSVLIVSSANLGFSSLTQHQILTSDNFLDAICNIEIDTLSVNIFYSVTLRSIGLSCT